MGSTNLCSSQSPLISKVGLSYNHGKFYDIQKSSISEHIPARQNHINLSYQLAFNGRWNAEIACQWGELSEFPVAFERTHSSSMIGLRAVGQYEFVKPHFAAKLGLQPFILMGYSFNTYPDFKSDLLSLYRSASVINGIGFDWVFLEHTSLVGTISYSFPLSEDYRASMNFEMGVRYALHLVDQRELKSELILANKVTIPKLDTVVLHVTDTAFQSNFSGGLEDGNFSEQVDLENSLDSLIQSNLNKTRAAHELERRSWVMSGIFNMMDDEGIPFESNDIQRVFCLARNLSMAEIRDKMEFWDKQGVLLFYQYNALLNESRLVYFYLKQHNIELLEQILSSFPEAHLIDIDE